MLRASPWTTIGGHERVETLLEDGFKAMTIRSYRSLAVVLVMGLCAVLLPFGSTASAQGPDEFTITGRGWGHGVGMSQHGAYGRASDGHSYQDILQFYYPGTGLEAQTMPKNLKILLATTSSTTVTIKTKGQVRVDGDLIKKLKAGDKVVVSRNGSKFDITVNGSSICPSGGCAGAHAAVRFKDGTPVPLSATGRSYAWGRFKFRMSTSSMYVILEKVSMRRYIHGLGEMPSSWPAEALKVQAVAARSYAMEAILRRRAAPSWTRPWDLYASTQDQAYVGSGQEVAAWTSQVDATRRIVATSGGQPIQAFYSSSNGGHTEKSSYVFVTSLPYLPAKSDNYDSFNNSFANWSRTYPKAQISKWLNAYGDTSVGTLQSISVSGNIGASGRTDRADITLKGSSGTKTVTGTRFMVVINVGARNDGLGLGSHILSTLFTVKSNSGGGSSGLPSTPLGDFESLKQTKDKSGVRAKGWAIDGDTKAKVKIHFYMDGSFLASATADKKRTDIRAQYDDWGIKRGFNTVLPITSGSHEVCAYAINVGAGSNSQLGCRTISISSSEPAPPQPTPQPTADVSPIGYFDRVVAVGGGVARADGWALDESAPEQSVRIRFYIDGAYWGSVNANKSRPDVGAYTGLGDNHGWSANLEVGGGNHEVCAYAINIGDTAPSTALGCIRVDA